MLCTICRSTSRIASLVFKSVISLEGDTFCRDGSSRNDDSFSLWKNPKADIAKSNAVGILSILIVLLLTGVTSVYGQYSSLNRVTNPKVEEVKDVFLKGPGRDFSTAPLWVWNDLLTEEQIRTTLQDLAGQNVKQAFIHPRPGLMTPYLGKDWFRLWRVALEEAQKLDMNLWIYDENSYPSGFAGGFVPELMPDSRGKGLTFEKIKSLPALSDDILFVYEILGDGRYKNVTDRAKKEGGLPNENWLTARIQIAPTGDWYAGKYYVDLLKKGVTEKFIEVTHSAYKRELGSTFGKGIKGIFTDEPHISPPGQIKWTEDLPVYFEKKFHYSLIDVLPLLVENGKYTNVSGRSIDCFEVRHNYFQILLDLFIERWAEPNFAFCESNGLEFTGHYWEHGWPNILHGPDPMAMYLWHHRPAIDMLMNTWSNSVHAQFGNIRAVRELASAANQGGRAHRLSETYGAGGWDLRFADMKRIGDWQYALGVSMTDEHLSYITIRGARKHDHPQSFSSHASWWPDYREIANWHTRMSWLMSQGKQANSLLIIQPTTTMWMHQLESGLDQRGQDFSDFIYRCETAQLEYDLGSEEIIARIGSVQNNGVFTVGKASYQCVLLPNGFENINEKTLELLNDYVNKGGKLLCLGPAPDRVNGKLIAQTGERLRKMHQKVFDKNKSDIYIQENVLLKGTQYTLPIYMSEKEMNSENRLAEPFLYHQRRKLLNGETIFLCNTDMEQEKSGNIRLPSGYTVESLDPLGGTSSRCPIRTVSGKDTKESYSVLSFRLPPCGSIAWLLTKNDENEAVRSTINRSVQAISFLNEKDKTIQPKTIASPERLSPNVLVVDYCSLKMSDKSIDETYFFNINEELWKSFGFRMNPWRSAVQFKDELIKRTFEKGKGFSVTYRFELSEEYVKSVSLNDPVYAVIEKADQYNISCNGAKIASNPKDWWLDRSFGKINLSSVIKAGQNELTIQIDTMNMYCEVMPIFILGNFTLKTADKGYLIDKSTAMLNGRAWNADGLPFYSYDVCYRESFDVALRSGVRFFVKLPTFGDLESGKSAARWNGALAKIYVNGKFSGRIISAPSELDVTSLLHNGANDIQVIIEGTPKNMFGPFHAGKMRGLAWPDAFTKGPKNMPSGQQYDTIPYGLLEPFVLLERE